MNADEIEKAFEDYMRDMADKMKKQIAVLRANDQRAYVTGSTFTIYGANDNVDLGVTGYFEIVAAVRKTRKYDCPL